MGVLKCRYYAPCVYFVAALLYSTGVRSVTHTWAATFLCSRRSSVKLDVKFCLAWSS